VDGDDPGVIEPARGPGLAHESLAKFVGELGVKVDAQGFKRHHAVDDRVAGKVDHSHCPAAEGLFDLITSNSLLRHRSSLYLHPAPPASESASESAPEKPRPYGSTGSPARPPTAMRADGYTAGRLSESPSHPTPGYPAKRLFGFPTHPFETRRHQDHQELTKVFICVFLAFRKSIPLPKVITWTNDVRVPNSNGIPS
jgi:hypothetical protein